MTKALTISMIAGAALFGMTAVSVADTYDRHVELDNQSDSTITQFFASNVGTDNWQEDVLGSYVLPPGYHVRINLDDGTGYCHFDFKTIFRDGSTVVRHDINVCAVTKYTLTD